MFKPFEYKSSGLECKTLLPHKQSEQAECAMFQGAFLPDTALACTFHHIFLSSLVSKISKARLDKATHPDF
jgi:hypothetical protein